VAGILVVLPRSLRDAAVVANGIADALNRVQEALEGGDETAVVVITNGERFQQLLETVEGIRLTDLLYEPLREHEIRRVQRPLFEVRRRHSRQRRLHSSPRLPLRRLLQGGRASTSVAQATKGRYQYHAKLHQAVRLRSVRKVLSQRRRFSRMPRPRAGHGRRGDEED